MKLSEISQHLKTFTQEYEKGNLDKLSQDQLCEKIQQLKGQLLKTLEATYQQKISDLAVFSITVEDKTIRKTAKQIFRLEVKVNKKFNEQPAGNLPQPEVKLFKKVVKGDLDFVKKSPHIAYLDPATGETALHWSALYGVDKVTHYLLGKVSLDSRDAQGQTALHWAAKANQVQQAKILVVAGANVNLVDRDQKSAAELASGRACSIFLKALPQNQTNRFHAFDDDSTSQEELDQVRKVGIVELEDKLSTFSGLSSFLLREFSLRLFVSKEVNTHYYSLKLERLANPETFSTEKMVALIQESFNATCEGLGVEYQADPIIDYFLENKRRFLRALYRDKDQKEFSDLFKEMTVQSRPDLFSLIIRDIFKEAGIPFGTSGKVKRVIEKIPVRSALKKLILESLLTTKKRTSFSTFLKAHQSEFNKIILDKIFLDCFMTHMRLKWAVARKEKGAGRKVLEEGFTLSSAPFSLPLFLAFIRLNSRSNMRLIKNFMLFGDVTETSKKVVGSFFQFPGIEKMAYETQRVNLSGTRLDLVETSASYCDLYTSLSAIKKSLKVEDAQIASWVSLTLQGNAKDWLSKLNIKSFDLQNLQKFINSLTYLLFFTEVARNPSSLLLHQMMLELIEKKKMTWEEALVDEKMPMSISEAVAASRGLSRLLNPQTSVARSYDKTVSGNISAPDVLMEKEHTLFQSWLAFKTGRSKLSLYTTVELLIQKCENWYGITVDSGKVLRDLMHAKDPDHQDEIELLDEQELEILKEIHAHGDEERLQALLDLDQEFYDLLELYDKDAEKFAALSESEVLKLLENENTTFSYLSDLYDDDPDTFKELVEDPDDLLHTRYEGNFEAMVNDYYENISSEHSQHERDDYEEKKTPYVKMQESEQYTTSSEEKASMGRSTKQFGD